jgi:hypothetical protein
MKNTAAIAGAGLFAAAGGISMDAKTKSVSCQEPSMTIPETVFEWTRSDTVTRIEPSAIFQYMDGAGELYVGYRFDSLEAATYRAQGRPDILVEVYHMRTSDDAFGLLSQDWGGEPVSLSDPAATEADVRLVPAARALYGAGLLRAWSGDLYLRILASEETAESRNAVIELGRRLCSGRPIRPRPVLLGMLPEAVGSWKAAIQDVRFLRSRHVLNSVYFLSFQNILALDPSVDGAAAAYTESDGAGAEKRVQCIVLGYADARKARAALSGFHNAYFPEHAADTSGGIPDDAARLYPVENGWAGWLLHSRFAVLVFDGPDRTSSERFLLEILKRIPILEEGNHG